MYRVKTMARMWLLIGSVAIFLVGCSETTKDIKGIVKHFEDNGLRATDRTSEFVEDSSTYQIVIEEVNPDNFISMQVEDENGQMNFHIFDIQDGRGKDAVVKGFEPFGGTIDAEIIQNRNLVFLRGWYTPNNPDELDELKEELGGKVIDLFKKY